MAIDLRQLRYFATVVEEGHFGRAAKRLGIKQPPLSQQIQRLEAALGFRLLHRKPKVEPTEPGRVLWLETRQLLRQMDAALDATRNAGRGESGTLTIGLTSSMMLTRLAEFISVFRQRHPHVMLRLRELPSVAQPAEIRAGTINVGFAREPVPTSGLIIEPILHEPFLVMLPPEHPLAKRSALRLTQLKDEPFVLFPRAEAPAVHDRILGLCRAAGFTPHITQETGDWVTIIGLVAAGLGVSLAPASFERVQWGNIIYRPLRPRTEPTHIAMCYRAEEQSSPTMSRFIEIVHERASTR